LSFLLRSLIICLIFAFCSCSSGKKSAALLPGHAPDFSLETIDRNVLQLSDYRGKIVLLHFWASWCHACVYELSTLENLYKSLPKDNFELLAVAVDDRWSSVKKIQNQNQYSFPILMDTGGKIRDWYGIAMIPESFLVGVNGEFLKFPAPEGGQIVGKTSGPQQWDKAEVREYFQSILGK